jgi:hypothetical protein
MLPFGVTIPATVPQGSEIPEGLMNNPVCSSYLLETYFFIIIISLLITFAEIIAVYIDNFNKHINAFSTQNSGPL